MGCGGLIDAVKVSYLEIYLLKALYQNGRVLGSGIFIFVHWGNS